MKSDEKSLFTKLHLPLNTQSALRFTRLNGKPLPEDTKCNRVEEEGPFVNGLVYNKGVLESWKIENGSHTQSFFCTVNEQGKLAEGYICTYLGWIEMDQEYLDLFLNDCEHTNRKWDRITFYSELTKSIQVIEIPKE
jgi:hypothetical protein